MAHFAQIDYENKVLHVSVVRNEDILDEQGNESEEVGIRFLKSIFGENTRWIQTSYNNNFRFRYAGIGMVYNVEHDVFLLPQPYPSWILNTENYEWEAPIPKPQDDNVNYEWDEENGKWKEET